MAVHGWKMLEESITNSAFTTNSFVPWAYTLVEHLRDNL